MCQERQGGEIEETQNNNCLRISIFISIIIIIIIIVVVVVVVVNIIYYYIVAVTPTVFNECFQDQMIVNINPGYNFIGVVGIQHKAGICDVSDLLCRVDQVTVVT